MHKVNLWSNHNIWKGEHMMDRKNKWWSKKIVKTTIFACKTFYSNGNIKNIYTSLDDALFCWKDYAEFYKTHLLSCNSFSFFLQKNLFWVVARTISWVNVDQKTRKNPFIFGLSLLKPELSSPYISFELTTYRLNTNSSDLHRWGRKEQMTAINIHFDWSPPYLIVGRL